MFILFTRELTQNFKKKFATEFPSNLVYIEFKFRQNTLLALNQKNYVITCTKLMQTFNE